MNRTFLDHDVCESESRLLPYVLLFEIARLGVHSAGYRSCVVNAQVDYGAVIGQQLNHGELSGSWILLWIFAVPSVSCQLCCM